jgi:flagellar assembly factor FliW
MQIETVHFGIVEVSEEDIISFPEGVPGFEDVRQFVLLGRGGGDASFFWLQSADRPEVCFVVTDPFVIYNGYTVDISDPDLELLKITDPEKVLTLAIVVIPENILDARVNLKAPVVINIEERLGKQVLQENESLPIRYYFNRR